MGVVVAVIVALIGGFVQSRRHPQHLAADVHMVWWMAVVGAMSLLGAGYQVLWGARIAEFIGYTRGDGGFQWETAMGDLAIGVLGIMAFWFRGHFWLATIMVLSIRFVGNAAGHLYYVVVDHRPTPDNFGILLCSDILVPTVMWVLFVMSRRHKGDAVPKGETRLVPAGPISIPPTSATI